MTTLAHRGMRLLLPPLMLRLSLIRPIHTHAFVASTTQSLYNIPCMNKPQRITTTTELRFSSGGNAPPPQISRINKDQMSQVLKGVEDGNPENVIVIDVRNVDEIADTGKLSDVVETLPLPAIANYGAFNMEADDFEEQFGFEKPTPDCTIVFTCKSGIRSNQAAQFAAMAGYTNLVNYMGGANEWFAGSGGGQW
mmetsp:Transcript_19865/g.24518  ORF Transcript_19865/g.24518 Transcript_19865/m.24518 type:complete len:195 (+) Transcript_19865:63-647(+)|eukprot:CAMPEP_0172496244 /NCGR_PEP_ID=MMETSP1066-20121228/83933_1 /TAXON_ID=671091 /ORGANISM="Coscinodiscus wailesii, Strain CCMP2513" /LENGTH=194 /DNA_ID=CAMNT_0013268433 /DNA_START=49 /DNA_END=630 /DNA_ORIENTATION=+